MRERDIERALVKAVEAAGGVCYKFVSPGHRGVPDRIVLLPGQHVQFVELKAPGKTLDKHQAREHRRILNMGYGAWVLDSLDAVRLFMRRGEL